MTVGILMSLIKGAGC